MEHSSSSEGRRQEIVSERPHCSLDRFLSNPYRCMSDCLHAVRELTESYFTKSGRQVKLVGGRPANAKFSVQVVEMSGRLVSWRVMVATLIFSSFLVSMFLRGRLFDGKHCSVLFLSNDAQSVALRRKLETYKLASHMNN